MRQMKLMLLAGILLLASTSAGAQQTNPYQLSGSLSAGGIVSGGGYQVGAALGQPGAGEVSGGGYTIGGGIFGGGPVAQQQPPKHFIHIPLVQR
jgi:hypothetical protein